jgi:exopolysaccharide biosynthesis polyprenyl glycosylphosphotransferase
MSLAETDVGLIDGMPMVSHYTGAIRDWQRIVKRIIDFTASGILIGLFLPIMVIIGILVGATSPGPILFRQVRVGLNKRRFTISKFRTMIANAENNQYKLDSQNEADGPAFKMKNDPRITRIGKFLRKTSLDELPQLFNVLAGNMSLVGPRPLPIRDYAGFTEVWHRRRLSVKPGITCLWQIKGRHEISFHQWMELDMEYIDKWSLGLDFSILFKTIFVIFKKTGT